MTLATSENIESALFYLSPDIEREEWVKIAMCVKDGLNGDGEELFDRWSQQSARSYSKADVKDTWKSIKSSGGINVGTLFYLAKEQGWKPSADAKIETEAERIERESKAKAFAAKEAKSKEAKATAAVVKVKALIAQATPAQDNHPYLVKKGVKPASLLEIPAEKVKSILGYAPKSDGKPLEGRLLIAPVEINGTLSTAELIDEFGRKSAVAGGAKSCGYWSAQPLPADDNTTLTFGIGEGVATILTANAAFSVGLSVDSKPVETAPLVDSEQSSVGSVELSTASEYFFIAALSAGNLPKVAKAIRSRYPLSNIIMLSDIGNGQKYAEQAARENNAALVIPSFTPEQLNQFQSVTGQEPTDFNDLAQVSELAWVYGKIQENIFFRNSEKNPTLPTLSSNDGALNLHQNYTKSTLSVVNPTLNSTEIIKHGVFIYENADGRPCKVIESKAAKILAELMKSENFAYNADALCWHKFTGSCWQLLTTAIEPERVILQALFTGTEPVGFKQAYFSGVLSIMLRAGLIPLPPEQTSKIPFKNGLFDMATRNLEPITKENALTWAIPHDYHRGEDCPTFKWWLDLATNEDEELQALLMCYINACLIGRADLQKFLHLLGAGGTGKSTFIRLLFAILGQSNCVTSDLKNMEENKFETACFYGKRLIAITDSDRYGGSVNVLKALTGQDFIRNERKNVQMNGTYIYTGMVVLASNEPLASTDYTSGLGRRPITVKFEHRIKSEDRAKFIAAGGEEQLHKEIPAIINWALSYTNENVTSWFLHPPQATQQAGFESLTAQNPIAEWITDNLIPDSGHWLSMGIREESRSSDGVTSFTDSESKLYPNYLTWCLQNKREALALRRFKHAAIDMLKTMGVDAVESRRALGVGVLGVRIKATYEQPYNWVI